MNSGTMSTIIALCLILSVFSVDTVLAGEPNDPVIFTEWEKGWGDETSEEYRPVWLELSTVVPEKNSEKRFFGVNAVWLDKQQKKAACVVFGTKPGGITLYEYENASVAVVEKNAEGFVCKQMIRLWDAKEDPYKIERLSLPMQHYWLNGNRRGFPTYASVKISVFDVDADKDDDLLINLVGGGGSYNSADIFVLQNNGGTYSIILSKSGAESRRFGTEAKRIRRINDFDGDGIPEVMIWGELYGPEPHSNSRCWLDIYHWDGSKISLCNSLFPQVHEQSKKGFLEICEHYPDQIPEYYYCLGLISEYQAQPGQAIEYYNKSLKCENIPEAYVNAAKQRLKVLFNTVSAADPNAGTVSEPNGPGISRPDNATPVQADSIEPIAHPELLAILEEAEKQSWWYIKRRIARTLWGHPTRERVETLLYALKEGQYVASAIAAIRRGDDKSLVPYLAEAIRTSEGDVLIEALIKAQFFMPNEIFIEPILDHALNSEYARRGDRYRGIDTTSVFREAMVILSRQTDGKLGVNEDLDGSLEKRQAIVQKCRDVWAQLQEEIHPVAHPEILAILKEAQESENPDKSEFAKRFKSYQRNDKLETIAYAIKEGLCPDAVLAMLDYGDWDVRDKRLVPFLAAALKDPQIKGEMLYAVVSATYYIRDLSLLPLLMEHALDSDYVKIPKAGSWDISVFKAAGLAIEALTDGKIGKEYFTVLIGKSPTEAERKALAQKWRQEWKALPKDESVLKNAPYWD